MLETILIYNTENEKVKNMGFLNLQISFCQK